MALIVLASAKGSPGVTTAALALEAMWPNSRSVVAVELDPAGGDLAARFRLTFDPGLLSLAASARREPVVGVLDEHMQQILGQLPVVVGPPSPEQAAPAVKLVSERLLPTAIEDMDMIADCGRLPCRDVSTAPAIRSADVAVLVARPILSELQHVRERLAPLRATASYVGLVLVGPGGYSAEEVATTLDVAVLGCLPHDDPAAAVLRGDALVNRAFHRLPLLRAAGALVDSIVGHLGPLRETVPSDERAGVAPTLVVEAVQ